MSRERSNGNAPSKWNGIMNLRRLVWIGIVIAMTGNGSVRGEERSLEFLEALRARGYHDYGLLYLDQLQNRQSLPTEIRDVLPLERALTLLDGARVARNATEKLEQLNQASAELQRFLKQSPNHPRAAQANSELGQVTMQKGLVEVFQSRSPSNRSRKSEFQKQARQYFSQARSVFEAAAKQHGAAWESFDKFIDKKKESQKFEARRQAEANYIQAQYNLAIVTFHESETYEPGSDEHQRLLRKAVDDFEEIYQKYRLLVSGLHARMMQGKCFEELGDIRKALGIYDEILGHPGTSEPLEKLKDAVQHFRMICLNHDQRKDYKLVIEESDAWLKERVETARGSRRGSRDHMGILWEAVRAREQLSHDADIPSVEKNRLLRRALNDLRYLKIHSDVYRAQATDKEAVIMAELNVSGQDPQDFVTAFGLGKSMVTQRLNNLLDELKSARDSGDEAAIKEAEKRRDEHVAEAARILNLALELADDRVDIKDLNRARYFLAVAYYYMNQREYDAAVIGEFIARRYHESDSVTALDAAYLAMVAYIDAYTVNQRQNPDTAADEVDLQLVIRSAEFINAHWPKHARADTARFKLGQFYEQLGRFSEAAGYFDKIAAESDQHIDAQLRAGRSYWNAYVSAVAGEDQSTDDEQAQQWLTSARERLEKGIAAQERELPDDAAPPENLLSACLTLSRIYNETGDSEKAVTLLAQGRFPVLPHVAADGPRPARGVRSKEFASQVYQQALRAYVGTRQVERAQAVLKDLEQLGTGQDIVNQLVQLGKQLQDEIERLRKKNDPRLPTVVASFDELLKAMFERENQTIQSLFWVGLTYFDLGEGLSGGKVPAPPEALEKFARSAEVFGEALKRCEANATLATPQQVAGLRLRYVRALRRQGKYDEALKSVAEIVTARPLAIDAQQEAAALYSDWATADPTNEVEHLTAAISGATPPGASSKVIWGWGMLSQKLMAAMLRGSQDQSLVDQFAESRYRLAECRRRLGLAQPTTGEQVRFLELALLDINSTIHAAADIDNTDWWDDLNRLNAQLHSDLGRPAPPPLQKPTAVADSEPVEQPEAENAEIQQEAPVVGAATVNTKSGMSTNTKLLIAGVMTLIFAAVLVYLVLAGGKKQRRRYN